MPRTIVEIQIVMLEVLGVILLTYLSDGSIVILKFVQVIVNCYFVHTQFIVISLILAAIYLDISENLQATSCKLFYLQIYEIYVNTLYCRQNDMILIGYHFYFQLKVNNTCILRAFTEHYKFFCKHTLL